MTVGSRQALFTFPKVTLYFSASGDWAALNGQISGTLQQSSIYLLSLVAQFSPHCVLLFGLDSPNIKPFPK